MEAQAEELIGKIKKWIVPIVTIQQSAEGAYQIVCDDFGSFLKQIETTEKTESTKDAWADLVRQFRVGVATCPNWIHDEDIMDYFYELNYYISCVADLYSALPQKEMD